jgi:hypothetical protein
MSPCPEIRFAIRKLTSGRLSSNLSMEAKHTIFAQKSAKNNSNFGLNSTRVSREKAVSSLRLAIGPRRAESRGGYWIGKLAKSIG